MREMRRPTGGPAWEWAPLVSEGRRAGERRQVGPMYSKFNLNSKSDPTLIMFKSWDPKLKNSNENMGRQDMKI
jgi:hypothetical protein